MTTHGITHEDGLGGSITILERGDETRPFRFRMILPRGFGPPAPEHHPQQQEWFRVLRGTLALGVIEGARVVLHEGDEYSLPAGVSHLPANGGDGELEFEATLSPGLDAAAMFEALYGVTREHAGVGRFARQAMVFRRHTGTIRFPGIVGAVMAVVSAIARGLGVRAEVEGSSEGRALRAR